MNPGKASVLVVDDVPENRDLLVRRLKRLGISDIEQAANGVEALAAIGRRNFDTVLLDIMMPELDGFGVLERLKADGKVNDLPIIVISALNEIDPIVRCIELGAEDFIFKPFNPTLLRARVLATIEKKQLRDQTREELRRKQRELNEARTLQLALVPAPFNQTVGDYQVAIDVILEPAKEVGGDLVDHFLLGSGLVVIALGDVSDKGAGAALMMARTHALVRGLAARPDSLELFGEPERALNIVNAALARGNDTDMFVTFLLGVLDLANGRLVYVRAGHVPPFLRRADGSVERLREAGGLPLGMMDDTKYKSAIVPFTGGDLILILTDGFTEAADPAGQLFGEQRIETYLAAAGHQHAGLLQTLIQQARSFEGGQPASDDMAAIMVSVARVGTMIRFAADIVLDPEAISRLNDDVSRFLSEAEVDARAVHHTALVIDEILTNAGSHGGAASAAIAVEIQPGSITSEIRDSGKAFDPRSAAPPDLHAPIEEREVGGLGLHLARQFTSALDYRWDGQQNCTTFRIQRSNEQR